MITAQKKDSTSDGNTFTASFNKPSETMKTQNISIPTTTDNPTFSPFTPTTYDELNKEIKRNSKLLNALNILQEESSTERENILEEKRYLLGQKAEHLKSILDIASNTPINDVDVNKLHKDIDSLDASVKTLSPQYNIKRSVYNTDLNIIARKPIKVVKYLPIKIRCTLDLCLDINNLDYHIFICSHIIKDNYYELAFVTPKGIFSADSRG